MATFWERAKDLLEWAQIAKFLLDIAVMIFSVKTATKLASYVPNVSPEWASIIGWLVAVVVLYFLIRLQHKVGGGGQRQAIQSATKTFPASPGNLDAGPFFQQAYTSSFQGEVENNVRASAQQNQPDNPEEFYVKLIAVGLTSFTYELIWAYIYRSQLLLLNELNSRSVPLAKAKTYYDKAATEHPDIYASYSFEQWRQFMKLYLLLIEHANGVMDITHRGRDFLKFLVHHGLHIDDRRF
jgi:hypothetical protein